MQGEERTEKSQYQKGVNWRSGRGVQSACISVGYRSPLGLTDRPTSRGCRGGRQAPGGGGDPRGGVRGSRR